MWYTKVMMRACVLLPQPRVADLYSLDKDELQSMLDPLKQRLDTVESEARETLDKVSLCVLCVCVSVCVCGMFVCVYCYVVCGGCVCVSVCVGVYVLVYVLVCVCVSVCVGVCMCMYVLVCVC